MSLPARCAAPRNAGFLMELAQAELGMVTQGGHLVGMMRWEVWALSWPADFPSSVIVLETDVRRSCAKSWRGEDVSVPSQNTFRQPFSRRGPTYHRWDPYNARGGPIAVLDPCLCPRGKDAPDWPCRRCFRPQGMPRTTAAPWCSPYRRPIRSRKNSGDHLPRITLRLRRLLHLILSGDALFGRLHQWRCGHCDLLFLSSRFGAHLANEGFPWRAHRWCRTQHSAPMAVLQFVNPESPTLRFAGARPAPARAPPPPIPNSRRRPSSTFKAPDGGESGTDP